MGENNGNYDGKKNGSDVYNYSCSKNEKSSGNDKDNNCTGLSSNGRIVSTNNKNSFISGNKVEKKVMQESLEKEGVESGKRLRADEKVESEKKSRIFEKNEIAANDEDKIENTKIEVENTKIDFINNEDTIAENEKSKVKESEKKKRYLSKTGKWTDFTVWVNTLVCEAEKNEELARKCSERHGESDVVYTPAGDVVSDHIDGIDKKTKTKIRSPHRRYDVIVDGANVGYYKQNFSGAPSHIDYRQVDWMLRQLIRRGMY